MCLCVCVCLYSSKRSDPAESICLSPWPRTAPAIGGGGLEVCQSRNEIGMGFIHPALSRQVQWDVQEAWSQKWCDHKEIVEVRPCCCYKDGEGRGWGKGRGLRPEASPRGAPQLGEGERLAPGRKARK